MMFSLKTKINNNKRKARFSYIFLEQIAQSWKSNYFKEKNSIFSTGPYQREFLSLSLSLSLSEKK